MGKKCIDRFVWNDDDFHLTLLNPPADAVASQAKPGVKAGNEGIDRFYDAKVKKLEERADLFLRISRRNARWKISRGKKPSLFSKEDINRYLPGNDKDRKEIEESLRTMSTAEDKQACLDANYVVDSVINRLYSRGINKKVTFYYEYLFHKAKKRFKTTNTGFNPASTKSSVDGDSLAGQEEESGDVYERMEKSITHTIRTVKGIIEKQMPGFRSEIEDIIKNKVTSCNVIENTLDTLLGVMDMGIGEKEFKMLNQYYSGVNKNGYQFYQREYRKLKKEK